jgi:UDP-glucuronate 4-epimerase
MRTLVTGAAGFIGAAVCKRLVARGEQVIGVDNLNSYYNPALKLARLNRVKNAVDDSSLLWSFRQLDIADADSIAQLFSAERPLRVIHLAAQAGVRHSIENPGAYLLSNLVGMGSILEACRRQCVEHLVYASSSSVYGGNRNFPFSESQSVNHPVSLYAATKKGNELMAHTYSHLYDLPCTGLRFFTVYGPWGRPDMAPMLFARAILAGNPIRVFNHGQMQRDFTFIDDIVEGVIRCLDKPATPDPAFNPTSPNPATSWAPHRIFNIGNSRPEALLRFIGLLENYLGREAIRQFEPLQPGDVETTVADTSSLEDWIQFKPTTSLDVGVKHFADWYLQVAHPLGLI